MDYLPKDSLIKHAPPISLASQVLVIAVAAARLKARRLPAASLHTVGVLANPDSINQIKRPLRR